MEKKELLKPVVAVGNTIAKLGHIVVKPFEGGWSNLGRYTDEEPTPAKITVYRGEDPLEHNADI